MRHSISRSDGYHRWLSLVMISGLLLACSEDQETTGPRTDPDAPPTELMGSAIQLRVDLSGGKVMVGLPSAAKASTSPARSTPSFALLGRNEIGANVTNLTRSAVGEFAPHRVRVRFDLALTNKLVDADLTASSFPAAPPGVDQVVAFPFATDPAGIFGLKVVPTTDWNGTGATGSGAPHNFFNDAICLPLTPPGDCFRWEAFGPRLGPGQTATRNVGFDVDPSVSAFTVYVVLAADIKERPLPEPALVVEAITPGSSFLGGTITVTGTGFGSAPGDNDLRLVPEGGGAPVRLTVTTVNPTPALVALTASLPNSGTDLPLGRYRAQVTVGTRTSGLSQALLQRVLTRVVSTTAGGALVSGLRSGFADGVGAAARFNNPFALTTGLDGKLYIADQRNNRIRRLDPSTAEVTTLAGGPIPGFEDGVGASTRFNSPISVGVGPDGRLYVADFSNNLIRRVDPTSAEVTTLAGGGPLGSGTFADGTGSSARFNGPAGVAIAQDGIVYVADQNNHSIRRIDPVTAEVTTLAGDGTSGFADGTGSAARFDHPTGLAVGQDGTLYVADQGNHRIRQVDPATGTVTTVAGNGTAGLTDGPAAGAQFNQPLEVSILSDGTLWVADLTAIRRIDLSTSVVTTIAGGATAGFVDGPASSAQLNRPGGMAEAPDGAIYFTELRNHTIRRLRSE